MPGGGFDNSSFSPNYNNETTANQNITMLGKVNKLSNKGWSYHFRLLKMNQYSLSYYKSVPKDFDDQNLRSQMIEEGAIKPKQSVPIKRILSVDEIQEVDKKKFKKLAKAPDIAFKVIFPKKYLIKNREYNPAEDDHDEEDEEDDEDDEDQDDQDEDEDNSGKFGAAKQRTKMQKSKTSTTKSKTKGSKKSTSQNLTTWYFVCDTQFQQRDWIKYLMAFSKQQNSRFIGDDQLVEKIKSNNAIQGGGNNQNNSRNQQFQQDDLSDDELDYLPQKDTKKKPAQQQKQPEKSAIQQQQQPKAQGKGKQQQTQQIDLFSKQPAQAQQKQPAMKSFQKDYDMQGRTDSEYSDLNQVLMQNLNINNVNIDGDGNINDLNTNQKGGINDDEEEDQYLEYNQDAKERINKLRDHVNKYYKQSADLQVKKTKKESKGWDLKFQNYWGYLISADKNLKDSMTLSERFFDHVGKFRKTAEQLVKEIIDELHIPTSQNTNKNKHIPVKKIQDEHLIFLDDEDSAINNAGTLFYFEKNICIKITHQGEQMVDQNNAGQQQQTNANMTTAAANRTSQGLQNSGLDNSYLANSQNANKNADPFQNLKWKMYGREFLSMDVMFDALFLLSKPEASHKLRVPLSAMVDYKGFRAIAVASIPIQPQLGPSIGFYNDGKYVPHDQKLKQELIYVGDVLNLKENRISQKGQSYNNQQNNVRQFESVPVSYFTKIFSYQPPESKNKGNPDTPTKKSQDYHFSELQYLEEPFYVLKTSEIFPYDVDLNEVYPRKDKYLRPEFVCIYERPLKADARKDLGMHVSKDTKNKDDDNDQVELNEASRYLKNTVIPNLVNLLDSLIIMPIDSESLTTTFHTQGVNMRYLGLVCSLSIVPHVRDICVTEMIARTLKNILNKQMASMILDHQKRYQENLINLENLKKQLNARQFNGNNLNVQGKRNNMNNLQNQLQEFEMTEKQLLEEQQELNQDLDAIIKQSIVDYINLVFGAGEETKDFWLQVLLPYTSQYFSFPLDELTAHEKNLNAIFFAFIYHSGIVINQNSNRGMQDSRLGGERQQQQQNNIGGAQSKDDDMFKEFGKSEMPFGPPDKTYHRIEIVPKSKTYGLRNLPYKLLADKYVEYKAEGQIENALKCCKMRRLMKRALEDKEDIGTIADICEISLDHNEYKIAKDQALEALKHVHPLNAEAIKFYCILMRAYYGEEFYPEANQYFSKAIATIDHHWGVFHPLHSTIYGIMAYLMIMNKDHLNMNPRRNNLALMKNKMEEAKYLYHSSLLCCLRVLGPNHIQTAEVHMDFGRLYLKMKNKSDALHHFEEAFLIYESYFGLQSLSTAQAAQQMANILEEQGKLNDAFKYAEIASDTFVHPTIYGDSNEKSISTLWLKLSISYSLKRQDVLQQCRRLYEALLKRDIQNQSMQIDYSQNKINQIMGANQTNEKHVDLIEEKIQMIKECCIATTILEMTRTLKSEERLTIKSFCDKVIFRAHQQNEEGIPNLADLQQRIDPSKLMSVANLKFDASGKAFFENLYQISKEHEGGFVAYYQKAIDTAITQINESKKQTAMQSSSTAKPNRGAEQNILSEYLQFSEGPDEFFKRIIKTFENYNFYNVLLL